jgi:hypothetical protein
MNPLLGGDDTRESKYVCKSKTPVVACPLGADAGA